MLKVERAIGMSLERLFTSAQFWKVAFETKMVFLLFFRNLYTLIYEQAVKESAIGVDLDLL